MKVIPASLAIASLLSLLAAGCSTAPSKQAAASSSSTLSSAAQNAMAEATRSEKEAKANFTLWVPVQKAYKKAEAAAKAGDSATVLKESKIVLDLDKIAQAQTHYPSTELK